MGNPSGPAYSLGESPCSFGGGGHLSYPERWETGRVEAERLGELRRDAEEMRVDAALRTGEARRVLAEARRLVEQEPLRERRWELLVLAQYRAGQPRPTRCVLCRSCVGSWSPSSGWTQGRRWSHSRLRS